MKWNLSFKIQCIFFCGLLFFICRSYSHAQYTEDDLTAFGAVVQGYYTDNYVYALQRDGEVYTALQQFAQAAGLGINKDGKSGYWSGPSKTKTFHIDIKNGKAEFGDKQIKVTSRNLIVRDGQCFFNADFYQNLFSIQLSFDQRQLLMMIDSDEPLPYILAMEMQKKSLNLKMPVHDSFKEYDFDERLFALPVFDLSLSKGWYKTDGDFFQNDTYTLDAGMLLLGMDTEFHIFGDSYINDRAPRARARASRIFLEEPGNIINLKNFQAGDILGLSAGFFTGSSNGRGMQISSFKDFITSADKTIMISGALQEGWEAELYQNDQLISFRQPSSAGRYEFPNVPVLYGTNNFKLVFYGPLGEIRVEEWRYYSGASPVAAKEFGYNISAYQQGRYLFENNEPFLRDSSALTFDAQTYYGINDYLTLMSGFTSAPDIEDFNSLRQYGMLGGQAVFQAVSFQYNAQYGFENDSVGHHFDAQGDIKIADFLARYEYFGDLKSPLSYQYNEYLKDLFEVRFSGITPFARIPWFVSFKDMYSHQGNNYKTVNARLSPSFSGYFLSLENFYESSSFFSKEETNTLILNMARTYGILTANLSASYLTIPRSDWNEVSARLDYRLDKNTFLSTNGSSMNRAHSALKNLYSLQISCGKIFLFGSLTFHTGINSDNNLSAIITYRMSFAKNPYKMSMFTDAKSVLGNRATVAVKAIDEANNPLSGIGISAAGQAKQKVTDKNGIAILTDMPTYAKTFLYVDNEVTEDISLSPKEENYKYVLRPGTVFPLKMSFIHKGEIEGQIKLKKGRGLLMGYTVQIQRLDGLVVDQTFTDSDGYFISKQIPFGPYKIVVLKDGLDAASIEVELNKVIVEINEPLAI